MRGNLGFFDGWWLVYEVMIGELGWVDWDLFADFQFIYVVLPCLLVKDKTFLCFTFNIFFKIILLSFFLTNCACPTPPSYPY